MKIYLGADHRGFELKEKIKMWLSEYEVEDLGAHKLDPDDDYTAYAEKVALGVAGNGGMGILFCGSGVGVNVAANKFDHIRASIGMSPEQVAAGRRDDDMNVLVLAADFSDEKTAIEMVKAFLKTEFSGEERHKRRIKDIERIEANN